MKENTDNIENVENADSINNIEMTDEIYTYLVKLLRAALNETTPDNPPEGFDWKAMYRLADYHSVACTVYYGIMQLPENKRPESSILSDFRKAAQIVLGIGTMQDIEIGNIMTALDEAGIGYVPLKGWRLKKMYPRPDMRSMCDVDILVSKDDMEKIPDIMNRCGFTLEVYGENDHGYHNSGNISVEIHWLLFYEKSVYYDYFKNHIGKAESCTNESGRKCERKMSDEDFYVYHIAHMAKHIGNGGTGIRSVMDVYVYNRHFGDELDWKYIDRELDKIGLKGFGHATDELAYDMFACKGDDVFGRHPKMARHILSNGTYGNKKSSVETMIHSKYQKNKYAYFLHRFFPGVEFMSIKYPIVEKAPYLLPLFWCVRGFRCVFLRRQGLEYELNLVRNMDDSDRERMNEIMKDSGLLD